MSDTWNFDHPSEEVVDNTPPAAPAEETAQAPTEPAVSPQQPTVPVEQPVTPPVNEWGSDGSYRYVPPRAPQPTPQQPPVQPAYRPPMGNPYGGWTPPASQPPVPPRKNKGWVVFIAVLGALAVLAGVVAVASIVSKEQKNGDSYTPESSHVTEDTSAPAENSGLGEDAPSLGISSWDNDDGGLSDKEIVKRNYASTVLLTSYTQTKNFYFGESNLVEAGASTGIVMTEDGYIITNWHCVINESTGKPFDRIDVTLYEGEKTYENATVVGADESTDLAVIHIDAKGLTPARFGDSAELEVGDRVLALGNAAGLGWSASRGIVSALARDVYEDTGYAVRCLQVDASINPGNSGGPLLNNQGQVIGINSAKISATDYEGIGFTIPINEAKTIIDSLLKNGYVKGRVSLGITGQTISSGMYEGFMIVTMEKGSSFIGTEAEIGDLIVEVEEERVVDYGSLRSALAKYQVGDEVELTLLRSDYRTGKVSSLTVKVTLQEQKITVN